MKTIRYRLEAMASGRTAGVYAAILLMALFALSACGSEDTAAAASCTFSSDCELGYSCSFEDKCIQVSCDNCQDSAELVCLVTPEHPEGTCSRPECSGDADCDTAAGETCNDGLCGIGGTGCSGDEDCADDEVCNLADECVPKEDDTEDCGGCDEGETCNQDSGECESDTNPNECDPACEEGETCNSGVCEPDTNPNECDPACGSNEVCNAGVCEPDTNPNECDPACGTNEVCNAGVCEPDTTTGGCDPACNGNQFCDNGTCVENTCPPGSQTPESCAQDPVYNLFDAEGCYCAECLGDSDCDTGAGETCTENGECMSCSESCDINDGEDACSGDGFFCINDCCVECTGNSDCDVAGEVCVDGSCAPPPSCVDDPSVCRAGTVCENGTCQAPSTGSGCTSAADCFPGTCNMQTNTCEGGAGSGLPGGCTDDSDCASGEACLGGLTCMPACPSDCLVCFGGVACLF